MEQIEIIERSVVESRRPISAEEALHYLPQSQTRSYSTQQTVGSVPCHEGLLPPPPFLDNGEEEHRYYFTGERDMGKDSSFFNSSQSPICKVVEQHHSHSSGVNNYGYDLNEVHTSEGGARIIQTHGGGELLSEEDPSLLLQNNSSSPMQHDRSLDTVLHSSGLAANKSPLAGNMLYRETKEVDYRTTTRPHRDSGGDVSQTSDRLQSILKNADTSWKHYSSEEDNSLSRKDSYKRMQENQAESGAFYAPSPSATIINGKQGHLRQQQWTHGNSSRGKGHKDGCWKLTKKFFERLLKQIMEREWSPKVVASLLGILLATLLLLFLVWLVLSSLFFSSSRSFLLYPPVCEECLKRNPGASSYRPPSQLYVQISSPAQVHFELIGNPPFKSNSFTAVDFQTGYVAIADHALTDEQGKHTTCFLMQLDRNALPDMSTLQDAVSHTYHEVRTQYGWQEYWQYNVEQVDASFVQGKFKDDIDDCRNAKWYFLKHAVYTRDSSCSECYDFCLPDYAVQRRQKYEDEVTLGIRRLNCFRLYVAEWSRFQVNSDESGGHWQYPKHSLRNTQRDAEGNSVDWSAQTQHRNNQNLQMNNFGAQ